MTERLPFSLRFYRAASRLAAPVAPRLLARRLKRRKETAARIGERRGEPSAARPRGALVWLHGASVGEILAAVPLIGRIRDQGFAVLVTSGTASSAALAAQRLPSGAVHQFLPLDAPRYVERFLQHWRPDLALFVESDLWPNMILACSDRRIPMILINGRLSNRSFSRWRVAPGAIEALLGRFDLCLTQSALDAERYAKLGAPRITPTGNLKLDTPPPPVDQATLHRFKALIGLRPVIAAASTHGDEETAIIRVHRRLRADTPNLLTVIAPRHPARGEAIAEMVRAAGFTAALRSQDGLPKRDVDIYIADSFGELGLIYRLAPVVFMGGSLASHGGQNPIEAIRLGAAVLHGPHIWNFAEIYTALDEGRGAQLVTDEETLAARIAAWLANPAARAAVANNAALTVDRLGGALDRTLTALDPYLMQLHLEQRAS